MRDITRKKRNTKCNLAGARTEGKKRGKHASFESRLRSIVEALESEMSETLKHKTGKTANGQRSNFRTPSGWRQTDEKEI